MDEHKPGVVITENRKWRMVCSCKIESTPRASEIEALADLYQHVPSLLEDPKENAGRLPVGATAHELIAALTRDRIERFGDNVERDAKLEALIQPAFDDQPGDDSPDA